MRVRFVPKEKKKKKSQLTQKNQSCASSSYNNNKRNRKSSPERQQQQQRIPQRINHFQQQKLDTKKEKVAEKWDKFNRAHAPLEHSILFLLLFRSLEAEDTIYDRRSQQQTPARTSRKTAAAGWELFNNIFHTSQHLNTIDDVFKRQLLE